MSRNLAIYLPSSLVGSGEPSVLNLAIVDDGKITEGKRAISRAYRDANASDPGRTKRVQWEVWGPIGLSLESTSQGLATDFTQNLESRWERRLISGGAGNTVTLNGDDPPGLGSAFGTAYFGTGYFSGRATAPSIDVVVFDEQQDNLFAHRGILSTQIDLSNWSVVETVNQIEPVLDAASWRGLGRIAVGSAIPMQTRTAVTSIGCTYTNTVATSPSQSVYAYAVKRGSDRAWYIDAATGSTENYAGYSLDSFATLASPFQVGDPSVPTTGIGPFGPFTYFGAEDNLYSFTDQGKPVPLSRALLNHRSTKNGIQWADPGWGWNYAITSIGLRAIQGGVDNPVGIGERMRGFTGHNGVPTALWAERGELWVVYENTSGEIYGYRGTFGQQTGNTGQPILFPWFYQASTDCLAIFSTSTTTYPVIIRGSDDNLIYQIISADGRDDLDPNYAYSTGGGTWYGTTLDREPNLLKTLRLARFRTRSLTSGSSWQLAVAFDPSPVSTTTATYVDIGSAVTSNGAQTIVPASGSVPTASISGRTMKPRLVQVAGGSGASTTPPEINGQLELEYDERPEQVEEITVLIDVTATGYSENYIWSTLQDLVGSSTDGPYQIQLPDDMPPDVSTASGGGKRYAMLSSITKRDDIKGGDIEGVQLTFVTWPQAVAI